MTLHDYIARLAKCEHTARDTRDCSSSRSRHRNMSFYLRLLVYNQQYAFPNFYQDMLNRAPLMVCSPTPEMTGFYNAQLAYVEIESCPPKINAVNAMRIYSSHVTHVKDV